MPTDDLGELVGTKVDDIIGLIPGVGEILGIVKLLSPLEYEQAIPDAIGGVLLAPFTWLPPPDVVINDAIQGLPVPGGV